MKLKVQRNLILVIFFCIATISFTTELLTTPYRFPELLFFPKMPVAENNPVTVEGADLGRHLFYDPILSDDSTMSCSSCHKQKYAFSDSTIAFSKGRNGFVLKRNTMPLFNLAWYPAYFWDGRASSIEDQIFHPVREYNEMNLDWSTAVARLEESEFYKAKFTQVYGSDKIDSTSVSNVMAQFLRTMISHQSKYDRVVSGKEIFTSDEYDGFVLVNDQTKGDCIHCHTTDGNALGTILKFSNNGLDSVKDAEGYNDKGRGVVTGKAIDNGKFIVPSLRNLAFTAPYMHDGRFSTLQEVLDFYSEGVKASVNIDSKMELAHQGGVNLSDTDKRKIISFLLTLSDSSFVSNPNFSNPFK